MSLTQVTSGLTVLTAGVQSQFSIVSSDRFGNARVDVPQNVYLTRTKATDLCSDLPAQSCNPATGVCLAFSEVDAIGSYSLESEILNPGGLLAVFYSDSRGARPIAQRVDAEVSFDWGHGEPLPGMAAGAPFSVKWFGYVQAPATGAFTFSTVSDSGAVLVVEEDVLLNYTGGLGSETGTFEMEQGKLYRLQLQYASRGRPSFVQLRWGSSQYFEEQVTPSSRLFHPGEVASNSPIAAMSVAGKINSFITSVRGNGLTLSTAGTASAFSITARDAAGNLRSAADDLILTQVVVSPAEAIGSALTVTNWATPTQLGDYYQAGTPPPLRTTRTRRVPHPVLIGHAASLTPY